MKQFSQQLHKKAITSVTLQAAEQQALRERLVSYMEYHPLPAEMQTKTPVSRVLTEPSLKTEAFATFSIPFISFFKSSAVAAAILLLVVPFIAEHAVPGDTLYSVKVKFNEELRSSLTFNGYQKVEWETERVNRRIAEARLLASEGRLTEEVEAEVADAVRVHTESAKREIEALRADDADGAAIASMTLDTTLEVQSSSLRGDGGEIAGAMNTTNLIATAIDESRDQTFAQNASSSLPAYTKLMARAEQNTTRIYELRDALKDTVSAEELAEVNRRIADIERAVQVAIEQSSTDEVLAQQSLVEVLQRTQKLIVYMTELEVTNTVDLEEVVPVVLTNDEKQSEMVRLTTEIEQKISDIATATKVAENQSVKEKLQAIQADLNDLSIKMASTTTNFLAFKEYAHKATTLADDTILFIEKYSVLVTRVESSPEDSVEATTTELNIEKSTTTVGDVVSE
ncbi:MAG: hypothetical protein RLZZ230_761 [Candidatus Parcubacteria bacterium]|jgi:hypothetical protein